MLLDELFSNKSILSPTESVGGIDWGYFSATCWFFGRDIYDHVKYPIGLVDTDWGGTPVESWSSPDALAKCFKQPQYVASMSHSSMLISYHSLGRLLRSTSLHMPIHYAHIRTYIYTHTHSTYLDDRLSQKAPNPNEHSVLWNAMIYPFLNMTIYGAIWYQGEANAGLYIKTCAEYD